MIDEPPVPLPQPPAESQQEVVEPHLPTEQRDDGSLVIDLTPLAPPPMECAEEVEADPFNPEIVVCAATVLSPRLGANYGPSVDELIEGSAVPRARLKIAENVEGQINVIKKPVGGFDADGVEMRVKIDF